MYALMPGPPAANVDVLIDNIHDRDRRRRSSRRTGCDARRRAALPPCDAQLRRIV
ncbi:hypothetical protein [Lysobacter sp. 1R34A]|uniref:hypothetical protein n=1 Tax=Lysobacter sp. 1R34A TaxID=3445786 RepID=UPI003EEFBF83